MIDELRHWRELYRASPGPLRMVALTVLANVVYLGWGWVAR